MEAGAAAATVEAVEALTSVAAPWVAHTLAAAEVTSAVDTSPAGAISGMRGGLGGPTGTMTTTPTGPARRSIASARGGYATSVRSRRLAIAARTAPNGTKSTYAPGTLRPG